MAEYDNRQRKPKSRATASNETGSRQLKGFVDNRYQAKKIIDNYWGNYILQCKSEVSYITQIIKAHPHGTAYEAGKKMTAALDKDDLKAGYAPKADTFKEIMTAYPFAYPNGVRGHLLNDHLGGPGENYNLMPISSQANHLHLTHVENFVKKSLEKSSATNRLHYEVEAIPEDPSNMLAKPNVDFNCKWWMTANKTGAPASDKITSTPAGIRKHRGEAEGLDTTTYSNRDLFITTKWGAIDDRKIIVDRSLKPLVKKS